MGPPRFGRHGRAELPQHRKVVQHPDAAAIRADDQIVVMDGDVVVLRDGQVQHQRLPVVAVIERDVYRALRAGEQQTAPLGIRSHDVRERAARQRRRQSRDDLRPRLPIIARAVDGGGVVATIVCVERGVRGARVEAGRVERHVDRATTDRDARDRDVAP